MKYKLFVLTILASIAFYNYHNLLDDKIVKLIFYVDVLLCGVLAIRDGVSLRGVKYPRVALVVLMAGICLSPIMASALHPQGLMVSVMTVLPTICAYGFFWILMKLDIPRHKIIRTYIVLCAISTVVYFCNLATAPNNIFGEPILGEDITRGIIRLPVVLIEMFPLLVFLGINKWLITNKKRWLVLIAWGLLMVSLSVTRQIIAATLVLGAWFFFRRISATKKVLMVISLLGIVVFVLPMIPIYSTMVELSEDQRYDDQKTENIRITAWRYYTYENQGNSLTPIFGNGMPSLGNSLWGKMFDSETEDNGCFAADVGWAGFFWHYGALATAALMVIMIKAAAKRKPDDQQYLTYWMIYIAVTSLASGPIIYYNWIMSISVVLYLVFKKDDDNDSERADTLPDIPVSPSTPAEATLPKYPQLER